MEIEKVSPKKIHNQLSSIYIGAGILVVVIVLLLNIFPEKKNDVDPVLSMKDFGFETSYLSSSYLSDKDSQYHFAIKESKDSEISFNLDVYNCKSEQVANSLMETEIKNIKKFELQFASECSECLFYENKGLDVFDYIYELDKNVFNFDKGFILYKLNEIPKDAFSENAIFLQKGNLVVLIQYHNSIHIDNKEIDLINNAIEKATSYVK